MRFFTYRRVALAHKKLWQKLRFRRDRGWWLFGKPPKPTKPPGPVKMYDSITLSAIPADAEAVAGYVNGRWPTYPSLVRLFPHAKRLSISVTAHVDADCLDVEAGDAATSEAAQWVRRQQARGIKRPALYTSVYLAARLLRDLKAAGIRRDEIRLWTAHYSRVPHLCGPACGFGAWGFADATQYDDHALGRNLDVSLTRATFFE